MHSSSPMISSFLALNDVSFVSALQPFYLALQERTFQLWRKCWTRVTKLLLHSDHSTCQYKTHISIVKEVLNLCIKTVTAMVKEKEWWYILKLSLLSPKANNLQMFASLHNLLWFAMNLQTIVGIWAMESLSNHELHMPAMHFSLPSSSLKEVSNETLPVHGVCSVTLIFV